MHLPSSRQAAEEGHHQNGDDAAQGGLERRSDVPAGERQRLDGEGDSDLAARGPQQGRQQRGTKQQLLRDTAYGAKISSPTASRPV